MAIRDETRMLLESMTRLFEDKSTKQVIDRSETGEFASDLWNVVAETGVPLAALPEASGGSDAEWADLFAVLRVAGRYSVPLPLAETMLAGWVAASAGLELSDGPMTVGPVRGADRLSIVRDGNGWRLSGKVSRIPYASHAARTVLIADGLEGEMAVVLEGTGGAELTRAKNIANEARDTLAFSRVRLAANAAAALPKGVSRGALYRRGALARAAMMSGALERAMDLAVGYAQERVQFGRPISKFQAVQQNLAVLAGQTAAAVAGGKSEHRGTGKDQQRTRNFPDRGCQDAGRRGSHPGLRDRAPGAWGNRLHQGIRAATVHTPAWSWREEFGPDPEWAARVGSYACANGADGLWEMLTAVN